MISLGDLGDLGTLDITVATPGLVLLCRGVGGVFGEERAPILALLPRE
jgi:hypothetical protein